MTFYSKMRDALEAPDETPVFNAPLSGSVANESIKFSDDTGYDTEMVSRNIDFFRENEKKQAIKKTMATGKKTSPVVNNWMRETPTNLSAGLDESEKLSYFERQLRYIKNRYNTGKRTVELSDLGTRAMVNQASKRDRMNQTMIENEISLDDDFDIDKFVEQIPGAVAEQVPIMLDTAGINTSVDAPKIGAGVGAGVGSVVPGVGTTAGAIAGWRIGVGVEAGRMEASLAYLDYEKITDDNGNTIDPTVARGAALVVGIINGSLEAIGFNALSNAVAGGAVKQTKKLIGKKAIESVIKNPLSKSWMTKAFKTIGESFFVEGITEALQEGVSIAGGEIVKLSADETGLQPDKLIEALLTDDNKSRIIDAMRGGAQAGFGMGAIGAGISAPFDYKEAKKAQEQASVAEKIGETIESMDLYTKNPSVVKDLIVKITDDKPVYLEANAFKVYWQSQGKDPREIAAKAFGDPEKYDDAIENGGDIAIPASDYYSSEFLGVGEHKTFFSKEIRTEPESLSSREVEERIKDFEASESDSPVLNKKPKNRAVYNAIKDQLKAVDISPVTANAYAKLYESAFNAISSRSNIDIEVLLEKYQPIITRLDKTDSQAFINQMSPDQDSAPSIELQQNQPKGGFFVDDKGGFNITLLSTMDKSTFIHESGHLFLEVLRALDQSGQADGLKDINEGLLSWFGVNSFSNITTDNQEQFARGFEAYLMNGDAPSRSLKKVFEQFMSWLSKIYMTIKTLDIDLSDDIKVVFDKLVATDQEIAEIQQDANIEPLIKDLSILGDKQEEYAELKEKYKQYVAMKNTDRFIGEFNRTAKKEYKAKLAKNRIKAKVQYVKDRDQIAFHAIRYSKTPDGNNLQTMVPKLGRKFVRVLIGQKESHKLHPKLYGRNGIDPVILADMFGYESAQSLITALKSIESRATYVERVAREMTDSEYPPTDIKSKEFKENVINDMHNNSRKDIINFELNWLATEAPNLFKTAIRNVSERRLPYKEIQVYAENILRKTQIGMIEPYVFLVAERRAAKKAGLALAKGNLELASNEKEKELINHALYQEAIKTKALVNAELKKMKDFNKPDKVIGKTRDLNYVNAGRAILSQFNIIRGSGNPLRFLELVKTYDPDQFAVLANMVNNLVETKKPYNKLTYQEFVDLKTTMESIWANAKSVRQFELNGKRYEIDMIAKQLSEALQSRVKVKNIDSNRKDNWADKWLYTPLAWTRRIESWVDMIDQGSSDKKFRKFIWRPIKDATNKYRDVKKQKLSEFVDSARLIEPTLTRDSIESPELSHVFRNKSELIGALLHRGNKSNFDKLLRGYGWDAQNWERFINRMIKESVVTKADIDFAQSMWNLFETLKPDAQKVHKKLYGHYFNEITADPFETPFGIYPGGYFPAKVDPSRTPDKAIQSMQNEVGEAMLTYLFPSTPRGFTKDRNENYAEALELGVDLIPGHIDMVLKFIYINPAVKDVTKLILNKTLKSQLHAVDRKLIQHMLLPWLHRTATQRLDTSSGAIANVARIIRRNTSMNIMALNVTNAMMQISGLFMSNVKVPLKYMMSGITQYKRNRGNEASLRAAISKKSLFMKNRIGTNAIEMQSIINNIVLNPTKLQKAKKFLSNNAYVLQINTQSFVDNITWIGAYNYKIAEGATESVAVDYADSTVRQTQGSFDPEDLSASETGSIWLKLVMMFYNYFNMKANLIINEIDRIKLEKGWLYDSLPLTLLFLQTTLLPTAYNAAINMIANGSIDDDNDGDLLDDIGNQLLFGAFSETTGMAPIIGQAGQLVINQFDDKWYNNRLSVSPIISVVDSGVASSANLAKLFRGDESNNRQIIKGLSTFSGVFLGIPLHPVGRSSGYLLDIQEGKANPSNAADLVRGIATGRRGE
jgi:hypothetical protein